jgi:hypothetical protein
MAEFQGLLLGLEAQNDRGGQGAFKFEIPVDMRETISQ